MRALGLDYLTKELVEWDAPEPVLPGNGCSVLYRIVEVGVCGTDRELTAFRFGAPPDGEDRMVLGHEALGVVIASEDAHLVPGDLVVPSVRRPCDPPCSACANGRRDQCFSGRYRERGITRAHGIFTEMAADLATDLIRVPHSHAPHAILLEPLSNVEKAVGRAFAMHDGQPESAVVMGAGPIGLLAAMVLVRRGLPVTVVSIEAEKSDRAELVRRTGAEYRNEVAGEADIVIEAAGVGEAFLNGYNALRPNGVMVVLGAKNAGADLNLLPLIAGNRTIAGSVNAGFRDFQAALEDMAQFPSDVMDSMIARERYSTLALHLTNVMSGAPKLVFPLQ